jgi:hypothetical protein
MIGWWRLLVVGFPTCCEQHSRHYWMVVWDIDEDRDTSFKLSLS